MTNKYEKEGRNILRGSISFLRGESTFSPQDIIDAELKLKEQFGDLLIDYQFILTGESDPWYENDYYPRITLDYSCYENSQEFSNRREAEDKRAKTERENKKKRQHADFEIYKNLKEKYRHLPASEVQDPEELANYLRLRKCYEGVE